MPVSKNELQISLATSGTKLISVCNVLSENYLTYLKSISSSCYFDYRFAVFLKHPVYQVYGTLKL